MPKTTLTQQLGTLEALQAVLLGTREPIDKKLTNVYSKIKRVRKDIGAERIKLMKEKGIDWKWLLRPAPDFDSMELYNFFSKSVHDLGMWSAGRWQDTRQPSVSVKLTYDDAESLKRNIAGVRKLSRYYEKVNGVVQFDIFKHDLSEYGSYTMTYNPTTKEVILVTNQHGSVKETPIGKLPEAMKYIQENHWYDGKEKTTCECDYSCDCGMY